MDVGEIGLGIETVQLGAFNEGVEDGGALPTLVGSQEEKIFTLRTRPARSIFAYDRPLFGAAQRLSRFSRTAK